MKIFLVALLLPCMPSTYGQILSTDQCGAITYEEGMHVGHYIFHNESRTWDEATIICAKQGGHLAIINSPGEQEALHHMMDTFVVPGLFAYIGIHDRTNEGIFETVRGGVLKAMYHKWASSEPTGLTEDEDCGLIHTDGKLYDGDCYTRRPYICEMYKIECGRSAIETYAVLPDSDSLIG